MKRFSFLLLVAVVVSGCSGPGTVSTPSTSATAESAPTAATAASSINSLTAFRDAAVTAGYNCPDWQQDDESVGSCSGQDRLMYFASETERIEGHEQLAGYVKNGLADAVLVGENWAINGEPASLTALSKAMSGELMISAKYRVPKPPVSASSCKPSSKSANGAQLRLVSLKLASNRLVARFDFASKPALVSESFGLYLLATDSTAGHGHKFGAVWVDGKTRGPFIFDDRTARQVNYAASDILVDGNRITISFDSAAIGDMGSGWLWRAVVTVDGEDASACPGGASDFLAFP